jgi:hypothetical protein
VKLLRDNILAGVFYYGQNILISSPISIKKYSFLLKFSNVGKQYNIVLVRVLLDILPKIILTSFLGFFYSKKVALKSSSLVITI